jgi:hypothetical protein
VEKAKTKRDQAYAVEELEALKSKLRTATSEKETSDLGKAKMEGRMAYAMKNLAEK